MGPAPIALGVVAIGGLLTLATLPALLAPSATTTRENGCLASAPGDVERIAATIRRLESGGDYTARAPGSSASGAYQFIDESWAGYGGYPRAYLAPPPVQDAKAAEYIATVLAGNGGDVSVVPVAWYIGHVPPPGSPEWDTVPAPEAGNRLTPREYQTRWMESYRSLDTSGGASPPGTSGDERRPGCAGGHGQTFPGGWALPGPRDVLDRTADQLDAPHHDYPAWDWAIPTGTPIYAIRGGTVIATTNNPRNCAGSTTCEACGLGVTIADGHGATWTYCHGSTQYVATGDTVTAGDQVLASGNTGNSTGPHLHLSIRVGGVDRCPQPLISALHRSGEGIDPPDLPVAGCSN